jgi:WD40 repeat protein
VKLWDVAPNGTLKEKQTLSGHTGPVYAVAFHPTDPNVLATASQDKTARLWDLAEGKTRLELKGHTDTVDTIAFSPDGKTLATGGVDKAVKLWDAADGKELKTLGAHDGSVYTVCFSPDGKLLASAGSGKDNLIKVWDVKEQKELKQLKGHDLPVTSVAFAGPETVVSSSLDRTLRVWNAAEGTETKKLGPTTDDPYAIAWSEKAKRLGVCAYSGQITLWALDDEKPKMMVPGKSPGYCVAFTANGKGVLTGHDNGTVAVTPAVAK